MGKGIITILSNIIWLCVNAQHSSEFLQIDKIALQIPDSLTHSTTDLADYFNTRFSEAGEKSRAIFSWITGNIVYDIDQRFMPKYYNNPDDVINEVLIYKKGVCVHFAELLCAVANKSGIKSYVIFGCTKQNGTIDNIPHAWCACLIDSGWLLVDPTWGSGYIQNSRFIHKVNDKYYNVKPEEIINSHYPFDPLWQFSYYPVSFTEFSSGKLQQKEGKKYFNFADTLYRYENQPATARLKSSYKRIKDYGAGNLRI
jgi:transglutaminase/protease-like cytokinesis protein 3